MTRLVSHVAIVTGGATGLGKAICSRLIAEGASVLLTDIQASAGSEAAGEIGCAFQHQDVSDEASWIDVVKRAERDLGNVTILVNNAGILGPAEQADPENSDFGDWQRIFSINVGGVFLGCRAVIPAMRRAGQGAIVNISSIAALQATPGVTAYGASKAAVRHLTKSVAQYCAQERLNIRCNSVHPGNVRTEMLDKFLMESATRRNVTLDRVVSEYSSRVPLGDFTRPDDIASAVAFLCSADARHITGEKLVVDGGIVTCDTFQPEPPR